MLARGVPPNLILVPPEASRPMNDNHDAALIRAKAIAAREEQWAREYDRQCEEHAVDTYFDKASGCDLIKMYETGKTLDGKRINKFESRALVSAWMQRFKCYPTQASSVPHTAKPEAALRKPELADDTVLSPKDVVRLTGISLATIKRMLTDGRFPKPLRLSPRRIGWPAGEVKAWLRRLDDQRNSPRQ